MGWTTGLQFLEGAMMGFFLFTTASRLALEPTQPPVQWVLETLTPRVKWLVHEADQLPLSSAEVKNVWLCTFTSLYVLML
jgi:hypothetical protein